MTAHNKQLQQAEDEIEGLHEQLKESRLREHEDTVVESYRREINNQNETINSQQRMLEDYEVVHIQQHTKITEIERCNANLLKLNKRAKKQKMKDDKLLKETERDNVVLTEDNSKCIQVTEEARK